MMKRMSKPMNEQLELVWLRCPGYISTTILCSECVYGYARTAEELVWAMCVRDKDGIKGNSA